MPFVSKVIHVRWSGEGSWMPLGDLDFGVAYENRRRKDRRRSSPIRTTRWQ